MLIRKSNTYGFGWSEGTYRFLKAGVAVILLTGVLALISEARDTGLINGTYRVEFPDDDLSLARISCEIPVNGSLKMSPIRTENLKDGWSTFVKNLRLETAEGRAVRFEKSGKNEWKLENDYSGSLKLTYEVDLSFARKPWPTGNHTAAYFDGSALFAVGRALFIYSDELELARVKFALPEGMKVSAPWQKEKEQTYVTGGKFLVLHGLVDNTIVVGKFQESVIEAGDFRLHLCLLDSIKRSTAVTSDYLKRILGEYIRIFGKQPGSVYQVTIFEAAGDGGESYLNSFASVASEPPTEGNALIWANTIAHELFHFWNGLKITGGLEGYYDSQWFAEGFTEYYANLALVRSGIISLPQWLGKLEMHASMYQFFKRGAPYDPKLTLVQAGSEKWENVPAVYNGGALAAFCLDSSIRIGSSNKHSLDDLMAYMNSEYGDKKKTFTNADIVAAMQRSTGFQSSDFIESYVSGTKRIPIDACFSKAALKALISGFEVYLQYDCSSPETNRRVLSAITGVEIGQCRID